MSDRACDICRGPSRGLMCAACGRSYDRNAHREGSLHAAIVWAAGRARRAQRADLAAAQARAEALAARVVELEAERDALLARAIKLTTPPVPRGSKRGTPEEPCEYCGQTTKGNTLRDGWHRCNGCGEPGQ